VSGQLYTGPFHSRGKKSPVPNQQGLYWTNLQSGNFLRATAGIRTRISQFSTRSLVTIPIELPLQSWIQVGFLQSVMKNSIIVRCIKRACTYAILESTVVFVLPSADWTTTKWSTNSPRWTQMLFTVITKFYQRPQIWMRSILCTLWQIIINANSNPVLETMPSSPQRFLVIRFSNNCVCISY